MAKLFYTVLPTRDQLKEYTAQLYPGLDHETLYSHLLLRRMATDLEINLDSFFSRFNLSSGRFNLMLLLQHAANGLMPSELAQKVGVTQATISGLINSLEKAELVKRNTHEKDGRSFVIVLTEKGHKLCEEILPQYYVRITEFWSPFDQNDKNLLNHLLERLITNVTKIGDEK
ncbi:MAG: MarR family transcriptional regulator [Bdellovibrio sp.]|nr:MarR family transcriptional regulator [Bdellovibrio sp.]